VDNSLLRQVFAAQSIEIDDVILYDPDPSAAAKFHWSGDD